MFLLSNCLLKLHSVNNDKVILNKQLGITTEEIEPFDIILRTDAKYYKKEKQV